MNFISTSGGQFRDGSSRFRFVGGNTYSLLKSEPSLTNLQAHFASASDDGVKVIRTWAYGTSGNTTGNLRYISGTTLNWREAGFVALDKIIYAAGQAGVRLILSLTDEFSYGITSGGDKNNYCTWNNTINGTSYTADGNNRCWEFMTNADIIATFKETISQIVNRTNTLTGTQYKNDPTIMSWEIGNELEYKGVVDSNANTSTSARVVAMGSWISTIAAYIKSIDTNHLVNVGGQGRFYDYVSGDSIHNGSYSGQSYSTHALDANIDFFDFHLYPWSSSPTFALNKYGQALGYPDLASSGGLTAQLDQYIYTAKSNNKPVVIGEIGIDKRNDGNDVMCSYPRYIAYQNLIKMFFDRDGDGLMFWHYSNSNILDDNNYNIKPNGVHVAPYANSNLNDDDTDLRSVTKMYYYKIRGKRIPVDAVSSNAFV